MEIEYTGSLKEQILNRHKVLPIEFVYLNREEYNDVYGQCCEDEDIGSNSENWFTIKNITIVFYLRE